MISEELVFNFLLLLSASTLANLLNLYTALNPNLRKILLGFLFGIIAIVGMMYPYEMAEGLIFDGRSIVLSLVALFYGYRSGVIAGTIAFFYRLLIGGPGLYAGTLIIIAATSIGIVFNYLYFKKQKFELNNLILIVFNFFVHFIVYSLMFFVQEPYRYAVLYQMALPFLIVFPITGFIIAKVLLIQNEFIEKANKVKESEEKFSLIFYKSAIPLLLVEANNLIIKDVNDALVYLFQIKKEEILGKELSKAGLFDRRTIEEKIIPKLKSDAKIKSFDLTVVTKNNKETDLVFSYENIKINNSDHYLISLIDVTHQKEAFNEIVKLNRIYLMLNEINQLIVRTKDIDELIKKACDISVEIGGFPLVWISQYDEQNDIVKVLHSAGPAKDILPHIEMSLYDENYKYCPAIRCCKEKVQIIINDWETNPEVEPIRDLVYRKNLFSSASFPLIVRGNVFGSINFYSKEKHFFDVMEIDLLHEISKDISYAIESIENEKKRQEAEFKLKENVRFLSTLIQNLPGFIYRCKNDRDWTMEYITPQVEEITGYKPEQLIYNFDLSFNDIIHPDYRELLWEKWQRILAEKSVFEHEYPIITKSGDIRWVWERGRGIFDEKGELICLEGFITDITEMKKYQEQLIELNEKLKLLVEGIPYFFFYTHDTEGRINYISPSVENITGYSASELLSTNHWFLTDNPINELARQNTRKVLRGEPGNFPVYIEINHKNGEKIILEIFEAPQYKEGKIIGLHGVARDVTIEKKFEEKLINSERRFRQIFEEHSAVKIILDPETGAIYDVNNSALKFYGYNYDEFRNMKLRDIEFEPVKNVLIKANEAREKGIPEIETKHKLKDGSVKDVAVFFSDVEIDGKNYIHLIIVDITEAKKLEKEIELERFKFQQLFDNSPIAIAMIDSNNRIKTLNSKFLEFFNVNYDEAIEKEFSKVCCKEELEETLNIFISQILSGHKKFKETYIQKRDGTIAYVHIMGIPIFIQAEIVGAFILILDLTHIKKAEEDMRAAKELAEMASKMKDTFIANISHEIRTPLNAILGYFDLIKDLTENHLGEEEKHYFNVIRSAGNRLMRTIEMIMNYSRIVAGDMPLNKDKIFLHNIVSDLCDEFKITANQKNLEFHYNNECGDVKIYADRYCLTQAIANLIDNAIKYTKQGHFKVTLRRNINSEVELEIADTGIGISEEYQKRIFEPYTQQELGWNRPYEGVGLGLALVKNYLSLNGIVISFTSKVGVGTTFIINFKDIEIKE